MGPPDYSGFRTTLNRTESHEIKKNSVVTGIEPTTTKSGLLDQRRSHSDNQAPKRCKVVKLGLVVSRRLIYQEDL